MNQPRPRPPRVSRETRLLFLTIVVSGVVLLLLARLRFPERPAAVDTSTQPLERLASRASFDELATRVARLEESIASSLIVLRLSSRNDPPPRRLRDVLAYADSSPDVRHVPALRIDATTALAVVPPDARVTGIVRPIAPSSTAGIAAADPVRHVARVRVPEGPARTLPQLAMSEFRTPAYVVAVEGTQAGLTLRPVFLGRSDRFTSPRWSRPLLPLGGAPVTAGALIFTLDGQFLGCVVADDGMLAIADAVDVMDTAQRVAGARPLVDAGIAVQPLTSPVALATGAERGVVVAHVAQGSPAWGVLEAGDVIIELHGEIVADPESLLLRLGTRLIDGAVRIGVIRGGAARTVEIPGPAAVSTQTHRKENPFVLSPVAAIGTRVTSIDDRSAFADAGLIADDVIVRAGGVVAPAPAQIRAELQKRSAGDYLLLVLRRGDTHRVTAVRTGHDVNAKAR